MAIETDTVFKDSGFDCDHCGGRILERVDRETGQRDRHCYQCEECGCQWTLDNAVLRVGSDPACRTAQLKRDSSVELKTEDNISRWVLIGLGIVASLLLLRFGGAVAMRLLIPLALIGIVAFLLISYGRRQDRW